jgi:spore germination cell wall hydrolase CwlJ-like protein
MVLTGQLDQDDIDSLALVGWKEARGEVAAFGIDSVRAVMHTICNRVGTPGFAHTLHDCIYGKNQFTSMSVPSDPEFNLQPPDGDAIFAQCLSLAENILSDTDNTGGAHYYANLQTMTSGWFERVIVDDPVNHPQTVVIGHHTFFI